MHKPQNAKVRYGMVINLDRCIGCGTCMMACAMENNVPLTPMKADFTRGITWMRVTEADNGAGFPKVDSVRIPVPCQHCDNPPCLHVCPVTAVETDHRTGIVAQIPTRCMGCRYCMVACPYHARYFNWWDPKFPSDKALNPDVSPRMRGVAEKCNFCHGRLQRAEQKAAAEGRKELEDGEYVTACADACPSKAIVFGNLRDENSAVAKLVKRKFSFRLLESLKTAPKVYYYSEREWVRNAAKNPGVVAGKEVPHG
ncbi:MAG: 4Fe-4S dicluster domain-containing protein [Deltaproteobacteria bacterium]|nr:4Fe-4S dicluster domain-containing protein [Deltaproteobacteria bacterium]